MNKIRLDNNDIYYQVFYKKIKNMYMRINDEKQIIITCNRNFTQQNIEDFIIKNTEKIIDRLKREQNRICLYNENVMTIFGEEYTITSIYNMTKNKYIIIDKNIEIHFKKSEFSNQFIESIYQELSILKAKEIETEIRDKLNNEINIENITYKSQLMKSRYGSCIPAKRIIKLNSILSRFSIKYFEAVLIHEILHLKVKNHQKDFYRLIDRYVPNYRQLMKNLSVLTRKYVI